MPTYTNQTKHSATYTNLNKQTDRFLLCESGDFLTQEDGGLLILYSSPVFTNQVKH